MYAFTYLSNDSTLKKSRFFKISSGGLRRHSYFSLGVPPGTAPFRGRDKAGIILRGIRRQSRAAHQQSKGRYRKCRAHSYGHCRSYCRCCNKGNEATTTPPCPRRNDYRLLYYYRPYSNHTVLATFVHTGLHHNGSQTLQIQPTKTGNRW